MRKRSIMRFIRMTEATEHQVHQSASILVEALRDFSSAWKDLQSARAETERFLAADRFAILALDNVKVIGWIGAIKHTQLLWELHPLAVHPNHQLKGIGKALVRRLEAEAHSESVSTIYLGTDDETGGTNIFGKELYPNVLEHVLQLQPLTKHPYSFYMKMGYTVVGVIPDAGGFGKHDIIMAKRVN